VFGDIKKLKIILAESNEEVLENVTSFFEKRDYLVISTSALEDFLALIERESPELVILSSSLSKSLDVLRRLKDHPVLTDIPVLALVDVREQADKFLKAGADEYVEKPIDETLLMRRVNLLLRVKFLSEEVKNTEKTLLSLAQLVEMRDAYTSEHIQKVASIALRIGEALNLEERELQDLRMGALLHDIGKIGVSEFILRKPGKLTATEFEEVKRHTIIGESLCRSIHSLKGALPAIRNHHERWDGTGYPDGLAGNEIPLIARIVSVADAFVSFTSDRPYRRAYSQQEALSILVGGAGSYWDPSVIWALLKKLS
jgi:putative two-component system response regulator